MKVVDSLEDTIKSAREITRFTKEEHEKAKEKYESEKKVSEK